MIEIAAWQDPELPLTLEYSRPAFERIRQLAVEGLIALPRVGIGVGGVLFGERNAGSIRVTGHLELPCSHTLGPTFQLTPDEIRQSVELVSRAAAQRTVVGLYCSRTRGQLVLNATDRQLFDLLCPEAWQIVFVLRPAHGETTRGAVFFRKGTDVVTGTVKELWEWNPAMPDEPTAAEPARPPSSGAEPARKEVAGTEPKPLPVAAPVVIPMPPPVVKPAPAEPVAEEASPVLVIPLPRAVPSSRPERVSEPPRAAAIPNAPAPLPPVDLSTIARLVENPAPESAAAPPPPRRPVNSQFVTARTAPLPPTLTESWFGQPDPQAARKFPPRLIVVTAVLLFLGVVGGLVATKDSWLPRPPIDLNSSDTNGMLEIRWNPGAARGFDRASLLINDGGQLDTVGLDALRLMAGSFLYKRKSDRVTVTLDIGAIRARTAFPLESESAGPGAPSAATPSPGSLSSPPSSGAISPFGNPPAAPQEPAIPATTPVVGSSGPADGSSTPDAGLRTVPAQSAPPAARQPAGTLPAPAAPPGR